MADWRLIEIEQHDAFMNMALDEACAEAIARRDVPATIRFYRWTPDAVSIGYFQGLEDEVNTEKCLMEKVDVVRRRTGGGAVYHAYEGEITYSLIAPVQRFPRGITESYQMICGWIIDALKSLNVGAEFKPINDIVLAAGSRGPHGEAVGGKKISGNSQTRRDGILLQHGTILYQVDVKKMFSLLKVGKEKISDKMIAAAEERVTSLKKLQPGLELGDLYRALVTAFIYGKNVERGEWTLAELARAQELSESRYSQHEWNALR